MAQAPWLKSLCGGFKAHRLGRPGWFLQEHRNRLRVVSAELPPRPGEPPESAATKRAFTLATPPGPATAAAALAEACQLFDRVQAGSWAWPDPTATPAGDDPGHLQPEHLERLVLQLQDRLVGEQMLHGTWERTWAPYLARLVATARERRWPDDEAFLAAFLRGWPPNCRARQMAYDRGRRLWKEAEWIWPNDLAPLRGNGKVAADPEGVRAFTDEEINQLREAIKRSRLIASDAVAWDVLICFGLRPKELQSLELQSRDGVLVAVVTRNKRSSRGISGARVVPAVPPFGWPADCFRLLERWKQHGLPPGVFAARSPGQLMTQQLRRLRLADELTTYGLRHAFALRLGLDLGLHVRESAELMGHSPAVHLATYGRRLDRPGLLAKVAGLRAGSALTDHPGNSEIQIQ
jgi:integrase